MKFARLRLSGFKSFANAAEIEIRDGLTGIVGPNGCGKSNLLEALRWVMGEGSARALRAAAAGMEDVIFAGTAQRPRRDVAAVQLVLDNRARRAPATYNDADELEIERQVLRGSGSAYRLNGREVRQKDVRLLLADAATGASSPALVSQGKVAAIVDARPQDRRQLLEDAAGIAGLNARRHEAEQRLRAAEANIARVADILQNLERQAAALSRQARAAQRYRDLSGQIRSLEESLLRSAWAETVNSLQQASAQLAQLDAELQQRSQMAADAANAQAMAAAALPGLRQTQSDVAATLQELSSTHAEMVARYSGTVQRLQDLHSALENARQDVTRETLRQRDASAMQAQLQADHDEQLQILRDTQAAQAQQAERVRSAELNSTDAARQLAQAIEAHAALIADARSRRAQAEAARNRLARLIQEQQRHATECARLRSSPAETVLQQQIAEIANTHAGLFAEIEAIRGAAEAAEADAERARRRGAALESARTALHHEIAGLEAEASALQRLRQSAKSPKQAQSKSLGELIAALPGYEAALAAAIGEDIHAALAADSTSARHWLHLCVARSDPPLPPFCRALGPFVQVPAELERLLAQTGIVDQEPDLQSLQDLHPGQRLVSLDGWLWRWDGLVVPPGAQAGSVAEALKQDNRLQEIAAALPDTRAAAQQVGDARALDERARATLAELRAQAAVFDRRLSETDARRKRLAQEIADWQHRAGQAAATITALQQRSNNLASEYRRLLAEPDALQARIAALQQEIENTRTAQEAAGTAIASAEMDLADLDRRTRAADEQVMQIRESRAKLAAQRDQLQEKLATLVQQSRERFGCPPARLVQLEADDCENAATRLAELTAARERIGAVNLRAELELQELQFEIEAQQNARDDLGTAMRRLRASIGTLNHEGRARLLRAFQQIERHFRLLFETLFGGGVAELELIEHDDPLLSGLEIRAQPPGKKLQSLSLLSGGEQALTAIALVFALFQTNQTPICVLDEVDASLDDSNVERLVRLLEHMAAMTGTRFLIVTHNPLTMAAMHRLYGVTMAEAGVSRLVSVTLPQAQEFTAV